MWFSVTQFIYLLQASTFSTGSNGLHLQVVSMFYTFLNLSLFLKVDLLTLYFSCECHGHGDTCDPVTGEKCNCGNNTESDISCQTTSSSKNSAQECWRSQCVKCKDLYMGDPRNGHQCYKTINIENKLCFDGKSIGMILSYVVKDTVLT